MAIQNRHLKKILIVDDEKGFCDSLGRALEDEYAVLSAYSSDDARRLFWQADVALIDVRLANDPTNEEGLELLSEFRELKPFLPIIMATRYGDIRIAVEAIKKGAIDFLTKPLDLPKLKTTIRNSLEHINLRRTVSSLTIEAQRLKPIELVGRSDRIGQIRTIIDHVAKDGRATVLITGESGTGKEVAAKLIHRKGWRSRESFIRAPLNTFSVSTFESELFGHEKGAFTGADKQKLGYIEQADRGIIFFDDIDTVPNELQAKLLTFLQERYICRMGSTKPIYLDAQSISSTNKNLRKLIEEGKFREDLYYRIRVVEIEMPPLREHPEDIPLLVEHFLKVLRNQGRTKIDKISIEAMTAIKSYSWPGNVRELENSLESAIIHAGIKGHLHIELEDVPHDVWSYDARPHKELKEEKLLKDRVDLEEGVARVELEYIERALKKTGGRKDEARKTLGLNDRFALRRKIEGIRKKYPRLFDEFESIAKSFPSKSR